MGRSENPEGSSSKGPVILDLEDLHVRYAPTFGEVLFGISLQVREREIVSLIGPNGAGKSTTLLTISGLLHPTRGTIHYHGEEITHLDPQSIVRHGISFVQEGRQLFPGMTVYENLQVASFLKDVSDFSFIYERFPVLSERSDQLAGNLSGGEQQMLVISQALLTEPDLLLLDEPSLGLAPFIVEEVFEVIESLVKSGVTVLLVEQKARGALEISDRTYVLENGSIAFSGESSRLLADEQLYRAYLGQKQEVSEP